MPITRSAKKANRVSLRKRVFNQQRKDNVSKIIKNLKKLVASGDKKGALALMPAVQKALDKAAKENSLDKNTAARRKSRLSKLVKKLS